MNVDTLALGVFSEGNALVVADLFYSVGVSGCTGFVAPDIVAGNEDAVTGHNLTGKQVLDVDDMFVTAADNLDASLLLLVAENTELPLLLPIVEGANHDL